MRDNLYYVDLEKRIMSLLSLVKPIIGRPDSTEDVKLINALTAIEAWSNGGIGEENLSPSVAAILNGTITQKSIIPGEESRENTAFGTLTKPDQVEVTLPENGLLAVWYQALAARTTGTARAAIFLNGNQLKAANAGNVGGPVVGAQAAIVGGVENAWNFLASAQFGLLADSNTTFGGSYPTTGMALGMSSIGNQTWYMEIGGEERGFNANSGLYTSFGGPCYIFAEAGTYKISVQFKSSSGKVTVKSRKLWALALS
jgi:hypothetical protein